MNRYFIFFYIANSPKGPVLGNADIKTNGCFVPRNTAIQHIIATSKKPITDVQITSITELNESDYNDWNL